MELHLASMENITCWAFRSVCKGASDSYTGMLSMSNLVKRETIWEEVDTFRIEGQRQWIQVATSKEAECAAFLKKLEEHVKKHPEKDNIHGIQLNCSCPSPALVRIGQGPALIKRATKVSNLIKELLKQDKYDVGIKLRLGLNSTEVKQGKIFALFEELEKIAKDNPRFSNVTIHLKHAQESSISPYDYSLLDELASYDLPLIINGGIRDIRDIRSLSHHIAPENRKNIRGVMLGREALRNPACFSELAKCREEIDKFFPGKKTGLPESGNSAGKSGAVHMPVGTIISVASRNASDMKNEFYAFCKQHLPTAIYLSNIKEKCAWLR